MSWGSVGATENPNGEGSGHYMCFGMIHGHVHILQALSVITVEALYL